MERIMEVNTIKGRRVGLTTLHTNDHFLTDTTKHENVCRMNESRLLSREDDGKRNHTSKEGGHGSET